MQQATSQQLALSGLLADSGCWYASRAELGSRIAVSIDKKRKQVNVDVAFYCSASCNAALRELSVAIDRQAPHRMAVAASVIFSSAASVPALQFVTRSACQRCLDLTLCSYDVLGTMQTTRRRA